MKHEIKKINGKIAIETFYGVVYFSSLQDAQNFLKTQKTLKVELMKKVA